MKYCYEQRNHFAISMIDIEIGLSELDRLKNSNSTTFFIVARNLKESDAFFSICLFNYYYYNFFIYFFGFFFVPKKSIAL